MLEHEIVYFKNIYNFCVLFFIQEKHFSEDQKFNFSENIRNTEEIVGKQNIFFFKKIYNFGILFFIHETCFP